MNKDIDEEEKKKQIEDLKEKHRKIKEPEILKEEPYIPEPEPAPEPEPEPEPEAPKPETPKPKKKKKKTKLKTVVVEATDSSDSEEEQVCQKQTFNDQFEAQYQALFNNRRFF